MTSYDIGIIQFDMNGTVIDCNENFVQLIGSERDRVIGFNLLSSDNEEMWWAVLSALSGKPGYYIGNFKSGSGDKSLTVKAGFARIKTSSGEVIGGLGIFEELSDAYVGAKTGVRTACRPVIEDLDLQQI